MRKTSLYPAVLFPAEERNECIYAVWTQPHYDLYKYGYKHLKSWYLNSSSYIHLARVKTNPGNESTVSRCHQQAADWLHHNTFTILIWSFTQTLPGLRKNFTRDSDRLLFPPGPTSVFEAIYPPLARRYWKTYGTTVNFKHSKSVKTPRLFQEDTNWFSKEQILPIGRDSARGHKIHSRTHYHLQEPALSFPLHYFPQWEIKQLQEKN